MTPAEFSEIKMDDSSTVEQPFPIQVLRFRVTVSEPLQQAINSQREADVATDGLANKVKLPAQLQRLLKPLEVELQARKVEARKSQVVKGKTNSLPKVRGSKGNHSISEPWLTAEYEILVAAVQHDFYDTDGVKFQILPRLGDVLEYSADISEPVLFGAVKKQILECLEKDMRNGAEKIREVQVGNEQLSVAKAFVFTDFSIIPRNVAGPYYSPSREQLKPVIKKSIEAEPGKDKPGKKKQGSQSPNAASPAPHTRGRNGDPHATSGRFGGRPANL